MSARPSRAFLLIGLLVAACIPTTASPSAPSSPNAVASASSEALQPSASAEPSLESPSTAPSEAPPASVPPEESASPPAETSPSPSSATGSAGTCSGSDRNRTFFEDAAAAVRWTVYCAVLPAGWFVETGRYRGSGGGWVEIAYKGPGGARLELHEGAFCPTADGCVPPGTEAGTAAFGNETGTMVALDGGGWAVVIARGDPISWLAVGTGMDQATFQRLAAALAIVGS